MTDYRDAIPMYINPAWMFTDARPNFAIILHKTAGFHSAYDAATYFQNGSDGEHVSSHYIVGQDGTVIQIVPEQHGAGGNGVPDPSPNHDAIWDQFINAGININTVTISIEHIDPATDNSTSLTPAQKEASFALVKDIATRHGIDSHHIFGHQSICHINRAQCPGNYPWQELWKFLTPPVQHVVEEAYPMGVPNGWKDDGTSLVAPNGHKVVKGFRNFILTNPKGWDPNDCPLQEEVGLKQLEISNPSLGGGSQQIFRMSMLEWNATRGVFKAWIGQELIAARSRMGG